MRVFQLAFMMAVGRAASQTTNDGGIGDGHAKHRPRDYGDFGDFEDSEESERRRRQESTSMPTPQVTRMPTPQVTLFPTPAPTDDDPFDNDQPDGATTSTPSQTFPCGDSTCSSSDNQYCLHDDIYHCVLLVGCAPAAVDVAVDGVVVAVSLASPTTARPMEMDKSTLSYPI